MTTRKTPKPFHIGTVVAYAPTGPDLPAGRVVWANERTNGEPVVYVLWPEHDDGIPDSHPISDLRHDDDGSPLGEWVPLCESGKVAVGIGEPDPDVITIQRANAIIRGEVSQ